MACSPSRAARRDRLPLPGALADRALTGAAAGIGASATRTLEDRVRAAPADAGVLTELGFAYQLRWRETADASYLPRSEEALQRAVRSEPKTRMPSSGSARSRSSGTSSAWRSPTASARSDCFPARIARTASSGDALVELGRYDEAFAAFDRMVSLRPGLASYARVAYARELTGDRRGRS